MCKGIAVQRRAVATTVCGKGVVAKTLTLTGVLVLLREKRKKTTYPSPVQAPDSISTDAVL
jgi:hypothetical protein